jgi:hypothetical protein
MRNSAPLNHMARDSARPLAVAPVAPAAAARIVGGDASHCRDFAP